MTSAVVVFSGGQDSTTCLIQAIEKYDEVHALTFNYGQRHKYEIEVAKKLCEKFNINNHKIIDVSVLNELSPSSLTRNNILVSSTLQNNGLPNTFVPGRNIVFLTLASIYAYQVNADVIVTGVCETDFSGYPDCRDEFIKSLNQSLSLGLERIIHIETPLMWLNKSETWALADKYGKMDTIKYETLTCYNGIIGDGCGECPSCILRSRGYNEYIENKEKIQKDLTRKIYLKKN